MTKLRKRLLLALAAAGMLSLSLPFAGCQSSPVFPTGTPWHTPTPTATPTPQEEYIASEEYRLNAGIEKTHGAGNPRRNMDDLVRYSDAIVRARFKFAVQVVETMRYGYDDVRRDIYVGAVILKFDVLEYLKGSGWPQIEAVVYDADYVALTPDAVVAARHGLLELRDEQWDDRQAILFLSKTGEHWSGLPSTSEYDNRYELGYLSHNGTDGYTVSNSNAKKWLPAVYPIPPDEHPDAFGGEQLFFTEVPDDDNLNEQDITITLKDLKAFIADVQAQAGT